VKIFTTSNFFYVGIYIKITVVCKKKTVGIYIKITVVCKKKTVVKSVD